MTAHGLGCQALPSTAALSLAATGVRWHTLKVMSKRDPHDVLGVEAGASPTQIKAAWRRLARTNHPDLTGDDPAASRLATRRMAEINDAYAALTRESGGGRNGRGSRTDDTPFEPGVVRRRGGPPPPKPTRPVTGRVDMSSATSRATRRSGTARAERPCADSHQGDQHRRAGTVACFDTDRSARPRSGPRVSASAGAATRRCRGDRHAVRQVPRSHARADRRLRAVLHRLGGRDGQPRPRSRQRRPRRPEGPRSAWGDASPPRDTRAARPHSLRRPAGRREDRPPIPESDHDADEFDDCCRPDGHQACWPKTSYSDRKPDPGSIDPNLLGSKGRFQFRDRRPRYLPDRSRGGVGRRYARPGTESNGTLVPIDRRRRSGASAHQTGTLVPGAPMHHHRPRPGGTRDTLVIMPRFRRIVFSRSAALILVGACNRGADLTSFDPGLPCTADGRFPGAYPDLEAQSRSCT